MGHLGNVQRKKKPKKDGSTIYDIAARPLSAVKDAKSATANASGMISIEETRRFE